MKQGAVEVLVFCCESHLTSKLTRARLQFFATWPWQASKTLTALQLISSHLSFLTTKLKRQRPLSYLALFLIFVVGCASQSTSTTVAKTETRYLGVDVFDTTQVDKSFCLQKTGLEKMSFKELIKTGNGCVAAAKWDRVAEIGHELSNRDVHSPWGPYYLSLHAESIGESERVLWLLELAIKRSPEEGLFYYQKGRTLWKRSEFAQATQSFLKSVQLDTNLIDAHLFLGQIFYRDQDFGRAVRHFQSVLRVRPHDVTALMGAAECEIQSGDARSAIETLQKGEKYYKDEAIFAVRRAYVHEALLNDIPQALEIYKTVLKGFQDGLYHRDVGFSLPEKIRGLEMSVRGERSIAEKSGGGVAK